MACISTVARIKQLYSLGSVKTMQKLNGALQPTLPAVFPTPASKFIQTMAGQKKTTAIFILESQSVAKLINSTTSIPFLSINSLKHANVKKS
jgi:hypothetical protein